MIPTDLELRYDGPIPGYEGGRLFPRTAEGQLQGILQMIRERRAEHTDMITQWKRQIARGEGQRAESSMSYAKDLRDLVHTHVANARLLRMHIGRTK